VGGGACPCTGYGCQAGAAFIAASFVCVYVCVYVCVVVCVFARLHVIVRPLWSKDLQLQEGSTGEMSKYVHFLHLEAGHPLTLNPIETIFASN